jgi:uncharacterized membrane protein YgdD (TMEM256/DUF423 family)
MVKFWVWLGSLNAFLAVAAGAFGAHGLKERVNAQMLDVWKTGAQYHMYHALGMLAVAYIAAHKPAAAYAGWSMLAGIVLFSGSLYALALTGVGKLGMITPFGGLAFLAAWAILAVVALRS